MPTRQLDLESKLFKGFADKSRLAILKTILKTPKTVTAIARATKLSQPNTSLHLACLLECGLVQKEKKGREVFYFASMPDIGKMLATVETIVTKHRQKIKRCKNY